jgi:hypothetical protein
VGLKPVTEPPPLTSFDDVSNVPDPVSRVVLPFRIVTPWTVIVASALDTLGVIRLKEKEVDWAETCGSTAGAIMVTNTAIVARISFSLVVSSICHIGGGSELNTFGILGLKLQYL